MSGHDYDSGQHPDPVAHPEVLQGSVVSYTAGFLITLVLLAAALLMVKLHVMPPVPLLGSIAGLAFIALLSQTFLSFGLDIRRHNIWKSVSLVLTIPLFILTIGLTIWMFQQLDSLTMIPGGNIMPGMQSQPTMLQ